MSPHLVIAEISVCSAVSMLFFGKMLAYGTLFINGSIRPAPLIRSVVGLVLLARGQRFI